MRGRTWVMIEGFRDTGLQSQETPLPLRKTEYFLSDPTIC